MTTATAQIGATQQSAVHYGSISRGRKRTLYWSYFFLILFVIFFLMPPVYMFITSLKTSAEIGAVTNPWWVYHPTLQNYIDLLTQAQFLTGAIHSTTPFIGIPLREGVRYGVLCGCVTPSSPNTIVPRIMPSHT